MRDWLECVVLDSFEQAITSYFVIELRKFLSTTVEKVKSLITYNFVVDHIYDVVDTLLLYLFKISNEQHLINSELLVDMIRIYLNSIQFTLLDDLPYNDNTLVTGAGNEVDTLSVMSILPSTNNNSRNIHVVIMQHVLNPIRDNVYIMNIYNSIPLCHVLLSVYTQCDSTISIHIAVSIILL